MEMGERGGGAQRPSLRVNDLKKTGLLLAVGGGDLRC